MIRNTAANPPLNTLEEEKKIKQNQRPSQSPRLNRTEVLWYDLKRTVHAQKPFDLHC